MSTSIPVFDLSEYLASSSSSPPPSSSSSSSLPNDASLSAASPPSAATVDLAGRVVAAMQEHGFLFVSGRGLAFRPDDVSATFALARTFFASPPAEKRACAMQPNNRGWTDMGSEALDPVSSSSSSSSLTDSGGSGKGGGDPKEAFNFGEFVDGRAQQPLPPAFSGAADEARLARFSGLCYGLCLRLLELVAIGLAIEREGGGEGEKGGGREGGGERDKGGGAESNIDASWFSVRHDPSRGDSGTILRLLHYPAAPASEKGPETRPKKTIRAGAHSDYGSMTLLFRLPGQPGLEVLTPDNTWAPVPVQPDGTAGDPLPPILVNIGDLLSYWTGGLLKSTVHRVTGGGTDVDCDGAGGGGGGNNDNNSNGPDQARYSIAFFCHPCRQTRLEPVPSEVVRRKIRADGGSNGGVGKNREGGKILTADEHLAGRLAATYGWGSEAAGGTA